MERGMSQQNTIAEQLSSSELVDTKNLDEVHWCSWCFALSPHKLMETHLFARNILKCQNCKRLTARCFWCKNVGLPNICSQAVARVHADDTAEKLCAVCDGLLPYWGGTPDPEQAVLDGYCSWCFHKTKHKLLKHNFLGRNEYNCENCGRVGVVCIKCEDAFARTGPLFGDALCAVCDTSITSWTDGAEKNVTVLSIAGWCSWCFEHASHKREQTNLLARNVYHCSVCSQRTLRCIKCTDGMAQGGPGWDNSLCALCSGDIKVPWVDLRRKRDELYHQQRNKQRVLLELQRDSTFRQKALTAGLLRPFLLLVAMPPFYRLQVATSLGWTLLTTDYVGDPHAEAYHILTNSGSGMQSRARFATERIIGKNEPTWWHILHRTMRTVFRAGGDQELDFATSLKVSSSYSDRTIQLLEEEFLVHLYELIHSTMTPGTATPEVEGVSKDLREQISRNAGITRPEVVKYSVDLVTFALGAGPLTAAIFGIEFAAILVPTTVVATGLGSVSLTLGALNPALFVFGLAGLVHGAFKLILGSSEGRLFYPVTMILNQRLLLAAENIRLEDFYVPSEEKLPPKQKTITVPASQSDSPSRYSV